MEAADNGLLAVSAVDPVARGDAWSGSTFSTFRVAVHLRERGGRAPHRPPAVKRSSASRHAGEAFPAAVGTEIENSYRRAVATSVSSVSFETYYREPLNAWYDMRALPGPSGLSRCSSWRSVSAG